MNWNQLVLTVVLCTCAGLQVSCATTVGTLVGIVTFPKSNIENSAGTDWWLHALAVPVVAAMGPAVCAAAGAEADIGYLLSGDYGESGAPPFGIVFDPVGRSIEESNAGIGEH